MFVNLMANQTSLSPKYLTITQMKIVLTIAYRD